MDRNTQNEFDLYKDIQGRTKGEIYIGVVGPVRTGKSTFIKRFMDLFVLPYMEDEHEKRRTVDELPQSASGKSIMTTEPKFVPQEAAAICLEDDSRIKVRLIDCVGFLVDGASGYMEEHGQRMVRTPWMEEEIPFTDAAQLGTRKVIHEHATIGVIVTTDGTIGELPRESYVSAERTTVEEMQAIGKPCVMLLNSVHPFSEETKTLAKELMDQYQVVVLPIDCKQMSRETILHMLQVVLGEFSVTRMDFCMPKWTEMLPADHEIKKAILEVAGDLLGRIDHMREVYELGDDLAETVNHSFDQPYFEMIQPTNVDRATGNIGIRMEIAQKFYYDYISELTGVQVENEHQMLQLLRELSRRNTEFARFSDAFVSAWQRGYGVVIPGSDDIAMEEPTLIEHGGKYGVKMRAVSPSIHLIRANIETEIAPIVGNKEQASDLIDYIKKGKDNKEAMATNIFGKSVGELMEEGIRSKITQMDEECQQKLQDTMQKIVNDSSGGMVCIII